MSSTRTPIALVRRALVLSTTSLLLGLSACGSSPPVALYRLPSAPLAGSTLATPTATSASTERWLVSRISLPDYLDRDALLWPDGQTSLRALPGQRWAEPLRDAVPRVLRADLARLRGADRVWNAPLPQGMKADQVLRVEVLAFEAANDGHSLILSARWWLSPAEGQAPTLVRMFEHRVPLADASPDGLVQAHRAALWALAQDIAGTRTQ